LLCLSLQRIYERHDLVQSGMMLDEGESVGSLAVLFRKTTNNSTQGFGARGKKTCYHASSDGFGEGGKLFGSEG
jgi:hypothetical protein